MVNPCGACLIASDLLVGLFEKMSAELPDIKWEYIYISHPREFRAVEGLEVEKMPAVLIDGEQITAGEVLHKRRLMAEIEARS
jgi:hypothetical protein